MLAVLPSPGTAMGEMKCVGSRAPRVAGDMSGSQPRNRAGLCLPPTAALGCPMLHMQQTQPVSLNMFYSQSGAGQCQASATHWAEHSEPLHIEGFPLLAQLLLVL